jgi:Flp pilus assembly protein TadG
MAYISKRLKSHISRFKKREDGQALTEFALVAPILIMLAVGILLLGYFVYCNIIVVSAANQGARAGSALSADPDVPQYEMIYTAKRTAESMLSNGLNIDKGQVNIRNGSSFEVTVEYDFSFPITLPGLPGSHTISHTSSYMVWGDG